MRFTFTVEVEVERIEGKFASQLKPEYFEEATRNLQAARLQGELAL